MGEPKQFKPGDRVIYNGTWKRDHQYGWSAGDKCTLIEPIPTPSNWRVRRDKDGEERVFWDKYLDIAPSTAMVLQPKRKLRL